MKRFVTVVMLILGLSCLVACGKTTTERSETDRQEPVMESKTDDAQVGSEEAPSSEALTDEKTEEEPKTMRSKLLYMGHASIRITTPEEKTIYIDPFAGDGYEPAADLILVTHDHYDHNDLTKIKNRSTDCEIITWKEALANGEHQTFELPYVTVEAVEAGNNRNHSVSECVGYILTLSDGTTVYVSGDTSKTEQMKALSEKAIDYAFYCCDGKYNMDLSEAAECARLVGAKHDIPYHVIPAEGAFFDRDRAKQFDSPNRTLNG